MKKHFYFPSSDGITKLHGVIWEPDCKPRAVLQIAHGMVEYVERYEGFAEFLNKNGILVAGNDHLGHGWSYTDEKNKGYFAEEKGDIIPLQDLHRLTILMQKKYPDIPYFLFGHSMGSFFARRYLCMYPNEIDGAIICGTGWQPTALLESALALVKAGTMLKGDHHRCQFIDNLAFGSMNNHFKPARTSKDWLCRNEASVDKYIADDRCGFIFTLNGYRTLFRNMLLAQNMEFLQKMDEDLPVLFISGEDDPVGDFGKGVKKAVNAFKTSGMENVECILYPECRHELINELNKDEIFQDILEWLEFRI